MGSLAGTSRSKACSCPASTAYPGDVCLYCGPEVAGRREVRGRGGLPGTGGVAGGAPGRPRVRASQAATSAALPPARGSRAAAAHLALQVGAAGEERLHLRRLSLQVRPHLLLAQLRVAQRAARVAQHLQPLGQVAAGAGAGAGARWAPTRWAVGAAAALLLCRRSSRCPHAAPERAAAAAAHRPAAPIAPPAQPSAPLRKERKQRGVGLLARQVAAGAQHHDGERKLLAVVAVEAVALAGAQLLLLLGQQRLGGRGGAVCGGGGVRGCSGCPALCWRRRPRRGTSCVGSSSLTSRLLGEPQGYGAVDDRRERHVAMFLELPLPLGACCCCCCCGPAQV
jgi:hypothetical protein